MNYKISEESFSELCYFVDDWLRLMSGGSEWERLSRLTYSLLIECPDFDFTKYYYINQVLRYKKILSENK